MWNTGRSLTQIAALILTALLSFGQAVSDDSIRLPMTPEIELPDQPTSTPIATISGGQIYVVESSIELISLQAPDGLLNIVTASGPLSVFGLFVDGGTTPELRKYTSENLLIVTGIKPGRTELILVPVGVTDQADIVRQVLTVSGEGPQPPPGPSPTPPGPSPTPDPDPDPQPVAKNIRISVITDADKISLEQSVVLNSLVAWNELQDAGNEYRWYDIQTAEPEGKKAIEQLNGNVPGIVITNKASGELMHRGPIPETFDALKKVVDEVTGG